MKLSRALINVALVLFLVGLLAACQSTKNPGMMIGNIQGNTSDETEVYAIVAKVQEYISASEWDKWLALYSDDAILTKGDEKVSKSEMRKSVEGIKYKITDMEVLQKTIGVDEAVVSTRFLGNGKEQLESYKLKKIDGIWLIVEETNP
ncbi:nuclear transport factor 2 family protein [Desulfopila aestuarii]|uniref:DUF4878 domain-containing protein n=1 Tax=Desulfopila aestuarii DSM 18488 TaxID=1121416 RepID=A0A1M7Y8S5_9BACT|nr:nuclear transport factor 2 family protein [Desulfopila aestuarii]SHO49045.1 hypothetical protein SAMN02745220_02647 [Desulfopila aestuarii DSM 18488]